MTTREEIIRMAREAGFSWYGKHMDHGGDHDVWKGDIERFYALATADLAAEVTRLEMECAALHSRMKVIAAAKQEECAKVCEKAWVEMLKYWGEGQAKAACMDCAAAIRALK